MEFQGSVARMLNIGEKQIPVRVPVKVIAEIDIGITIREVFVMGQPACDADVSKELAPADTADLVKTVRETIECKINSPTVHRPI